MPNKGESGAKNKRKKARSGENRNSEQKTAQTGGNTLQGWVIKESAATNMADPGKNKPSASGSTTSNPTKSNEATRLQGESVILTERLRPRHESGRSKNDNEDEETANHDEQSVIEGDQCCPNSEKILQVLQRLERRMKTVEEKLDGIDENKKAVQRIKKKQDEQEQKMVQLEGDQEKTEFLTNMVINQDRQLKDMSEKLLETKAWSMRANLVIGGIIETPNEDCQQKVIDFLQNTVRVDKVPGIKKAHRLGKSSTTGRSMLVKLKDHNEKRYIFAKVSNLAGKQNSQKNYYYIEDQLPDELQERRRQQREMIKENNKLPASHKKELKMKKGDLMIDGQKYTNKMSPPTVAEMCKVSMSDEELIRIMQIHQSNPQVESFSKFIGMAAVVTTYDDVRRAYIKARIMYPDAHHIACAFRLPFCKGIEMQEAIDDKEHGAGRAMLKHLKQIDRRGVAVFMARYFGGIHLGPNRFTIMVDVVKEALQVMQTSIDAVVSQPSLDIDQLLNGGVSDGNNTVTAVSAAEMDAATGS